MKSKRSFQKQKRRNTTPLFVLFLFFPYIFGFSPDSTSSYTQTLIGIGGGQYVYHDCSGAHTQNFGDVGVYSGRKFEGPYRVGLSVGGWKAGDGILGLVYPDLAFDWKYFSFGTTGLRIGANDDLYFESKWLDQPPFLSGRGLFRSGIGGTIKETGTRFWIGGNAVPYNNFGVAAQIELPFEKNTFLFLNGRYGKDKTSSFDEYGFSVGMRFISF